MNHRAKGEETHSAGLCGDCCTAQEPAHHALAAKLWEPRQLGQFFHIRWVATVLQYDWPNRYQKIRTGTHICPPTYHGLKAQFGSFFFFHILLLGFRWAYARQSTAKNVLFWKRHLHKQILFHRKSLSRSSTFSGLLLALTSVPDNAEPLADVAFLPLVFSAEYRKQHNLSSEKQILSIISALT